jgi:hypothetical protein
MITAQTLTVNVRDDLVLNAGTLIESADEVEILPPEKTMFDQLLDWLVARPCKYSHGFSGYITGIGATALVVRYGTWLAALMDDSKPVDPRAKDERRYSMISDDEMERINIEASSNLARLLERMCQDESEVYEICRRAYEYLPMPQQKVKQNFNAVGLILGTMRFYREFQKMLRCGPEFEERGRIAAQYPFRALGNTLVHIAYRSGVVERAHAGRESGYSLDNRRFTKRQSSEIMRGVAEHFSASISDFAWRVQPGTEPWPQRVIALPYTISGLKPPYLPGARYPHNWSLDAQSSSFRLRKEWM